MDSVSQKQIKTNDTNKEKTIFNNLPMICLVEIAGFIDSDKNCLVYRNISRKFNEAIQLKDENANQNNIHIPLSSTHNLKNKELNDFVEKTDKRKLFP